jgi:ferredoxin
MAYKIDPDVCINCGSCAAECPEEAISEADEGYHVIDAAKCKDHAKCVDVCPVEAISQA